MTREHRHSRGYAAAVTGAAWLTIAGVLSSACAPPSSPTPLREGAPVGPVAAIRLPDDLRVVHAGPKGVLGHGEGPNVVFDRPMRVLADEASEVAPPVSLQPAVAGAWRWLGSQAAIFEPTAPYPGSTQFRIRVNAEVAATDGARLHEPFVHAFESPRIHVHHAWIADDSSRSLDVLGETRISFTQPVDTATLGRFLRFENEGRVVAARVTALPGVAGVPGRAGTRGNDSDASTRIFSAVPTLALVPGSKVILVVDAGLTGLAGPLPMGAESRTTFDVIGEPRLTESPCREPAEGLGCRASSGVHLFFDVPVTTQELKQHLRLEPARPIRWPSRRDARARPELYHWISAQFVAGEAVTMTITPGLTNVRGRRLTKPIVVKAAFAPPVPAALIGLRGTYTDPAASPKVVLVTTQALTDVELALIPLTTPQSLALLDAEQPINRVLERTEFAGVFTNRKIAWALGDTAKRGLLELPMPTAPSLLAARFRNRDGTLETVTRAVVPARHLVSAHVGFDGGVAWVNDFATARPQASVLVAVVAVATGKEVFRGTSGSDGRVQIPPLPRVSGGLSAYVLAEISRAGTIASLTRFDGSPYTYDYGISSDTRELQPLRVVAETDRDIYRPGDAVAFTAVVREAHAFGLRTPVGRRLHLAVIDEREQKVLEKDLSTSAFGTVNERIELPRAMALGTARIELRDAQGNETANDVALASHDIRIEHTRAAEFEVQLKALRPRFVAGEAVEVAAIGRYLYGSPMAQLPVRLFVSRERSAAGIAGDAGGEAWVSGNGALRSARRDGTVLDGVVVEREAVSDNDGRIVLSEALSLPSLEDDERVTVEAEYKDVSGRTGAGRTVVQAFSAGTRILLRPPVESIVHPGKDLPFGVRTVDLEDADTTGVEASVRLLRFVDRTAKRISADGLTTHEELVREESEVATCRMRITKDRRGCALKPTEPGQHVVEATSRDAQGRTSRSSFAIYVSQPREKPLFAEGAPRELELLPSASNYHPGDVAKILVKNPWPGASALVTVEREGVRHSEVRTLGAADTVEVAIDATMVPAVHVGVHLIRAQSAVVKAGAAKGIDESLARVGFTTLNVENPARKLRVDVTTVGQTYAPGDAVEGEVRVFDALGQGVIAEVTISAVDEGMILLSGHEPPDTVSLIEPYRPITQQIAEPRFAIATLARAASDSATLTAFASKGAEGGDGGIRSDFNALAAFLPALKTDGNGRAAFRFSLPGTLTRYRVQALAVGEGDRYGRGRSSLEVKKPLLLRPFLPRVLRVGDEAVARVAVQSLGLTGAVTTAVETSREVSARVASSTVLHNSYGIGLPIALSGLRAGGGMLTIRASLGPATDAVSLPIAVNDVVLSETFATFGEGSGTMGERLGDLSRFDAKESELTVYAFGSPYVGFAVPLAGVEAYPYDCTEQLASKLLARLSFAGLQRRLGLASASNSAAVADAISKLVARQEASGLFAYWSGYDADVALSAYVLGVLGRAEKDGHEVPSYVLGEVRRALVWRVRAATGVERVIILDGLVAGAPRSPDAAYSQAIAGALASAFGERKGLSAAGLARMLSAATAMGAPRDMIRALEDDVVDTVRVVGVEASVVQGPEVFGGIDRSVASSALALSALGVADPHHRLVAPLGRMLVRLSVGGSQQNPREFALSLAALESSASAIGGVAPGVTVAIGALTKTIALGGPLASGMARFVLDELPAGATPISVSGAGSYGYRVEVRGREKTMRTSPVDRGLHVERRFTFLRPSELASFEKSQLKRAPGDNGQVGDLVFIERLLVNAMPLDYVVLDDPLPGGFEIVDRSIKTEAQFGSGVSFEPSDDAGYLDNPRHVERLPDRVRSVWSHLPPGVHRVTSLARVAFEGKYAAPPATAEAMYEPDVRGSSAGVRVTLTAP